MEVRVGWGVGGNVYQMWLVCRSFLQDDGE